MKKNKTACLLLIFTLSSCVSYKKFDKADVDFQTIDQIKLGVSFDELGKIIGLENEGQETEYERTLIYKGQKDGFQRAAFVFEKKSDELLSKTYLPEPEKSEASVKFLMEKKFSGMKFETIKYPRCNRHFKSSFLLLVNTSEGVLIHFNEGSDVVNSITWTTSKRLQDSVKKIENCEK